MSTKPRSAKKPKPRPRLADVLAELKRGKLADPLTLKEVARLLGVELSTVWRWTLRGRRGVALESEADWNRVYVRHDALREFLEKLQASFQQPDGPRRSKANTKAAAKARDVEAAAIAKIGE